MVCVSPAEYTVEMASPYALQVDMEKHLNDQINLEYEAFYLYEQLVSFLGSFAYLNSTT